MQGIVPHAAAANLAAAIGMELFAICMPIALMTH
jgi:hypothetical protein